MFRELTCFVKKSARIGGVTKGKWMIYSDHIAEVRVSVLAHATANGLQVVS